MQAIARISGNGVTGKVCFSSECGAVLVRAEICGLPRDGFFAFHIHEGSRCESAGGHYNPTNAQHPMHAGDLPPLFSCSGRAYMTVRSDRFTVKELIGRTVVIHENVDDFHTQPSGNPGPMLACGEVKRID